VGVVDDEVVNEGTRTAFSTIEEQVGGDGGSRSSQDQQVGVLDFPYHDEKESLCQLEDGRATGAGSGRR